MERYFRTEQGDIVNILNHTINEIGKHPNLNIYVATDSQNYGDSTVYVTAIVYRYGTRGAHYIFLKQRVKRIRDHYKRLFQEAVYTIETAEMLTTDSPVTIEALEFDYNNKLKTISTSVIQAATGWANSLGYKTIVKPGEMIAAKAADYLCRN